jgi:uncharacterized membrane protein YeaQ/YmgE (transglycosylase-associated protein family)
MSILFWILFGGLTGWIASLIMNTDHAQGILLNILIGIVGSFIGGMIANVFGGVGITGFNLYSLAIGVLGSVLLIWLVKQISSTTSHHA